MFVVIFICRNIFLRIAGKTTKIAKIRTRKNFVPHAVPNTVFCIVFLWGDRVCTWWHFTQSIVNVRTSQELDFRLITISKNTLGEIHISRPTPKDSFSVSLFFLVESSKNLLFLCSSFILILAVMSCATASRSAVSCGVLRVLTAKKQLLRLLPFSAGLLDAILMSCKIIFSHNITLAWCLVYAPDKGLGWGSKKFCENLC